MHIESVHRDHYDDSGPKLILVKSNLPALKNPLTDLFRETLARVYGLRDTQIDQLRDLAREGKVELLFLLDAYDELREEVRGLSIFASDCVKRVVLRRRCSSRICIGRTISSSSEARRRIDAALSS